MQLCETTADRVRRQNFPPKKEGPTISHQLQKTSCSLPTAMNQHKVQDKTKTNTLVIQHLSPAPKTDDITNIRIKQDVDIITRKFDKLFTNQEKSQTATDFVNLVNKICDQQKPKLIVSDQFSSLKSSIFKKFLKHQGISLMYTPVDHPASNGIVERVNQTITNRLRQKVFENRKRSWSSLVLECINEYNATIHTVTKFPPNYLMTGYDPDQLFQDQPLETNRLLHSTIQ
ncbi:Pro-Pol polyprotein [Sarcoptes scabiei]|uniref:Pro-Pol polyprotein n=1 Tax=Sarcoptes scabiei TaxID=52283 RepID=A0A834VF62_SARSC|nr:Pro-Pol polyprotein [Sarcoptes scabiei]